MAILWAGGEDIDFPNGAPVTIEPTVSFRSGYARYSIISQTGGCCLSYTFSGGALTSCWLTARVWSDPNSNPAYLGLTSSTKYAGEGLYVKGLGANVALVTWDGASYAQLAASSSAPLIYRDISKIDIQLTDYGASATVNVYVNGALVIPFSGDTRISSLTNLDRVGVFGSPYGRVSEIIVADEDTRGMSLVTLAPNAAGDSKVNWTGDYDTIDETALSDADMMYSNTNDAQAQVNLLPTPSGAFSVKAAVIAARCSRGGSSTPTKIALGVKTGGSINAGSDQSVDVAVWGVKTRIMGTNPVTTNPWTTAELDALQLNLKARA